MTEDSADRIEALFHQVADKSGSAPNPEMGGYGTGPDDRGV